MELTGPAAAAVPILILLLGLSAGSFLNAVIRRLLREGRSFCPPPKPEPIEDGRPVGPAEGRRRDRRRPVSARYLLVEAAGALLAFYLHQRYGLSGVFLLRFCIALCLLAIALIDLELMIIPTAFVYPAAALSLMSAVLEPEVSLAGPGLWVVLEPRWGSRLTSLAGALAGLILGWGALKLVSVIYKFVRGHDGLGDGDPPLLGLIGAFLGWRAVAVVILWSTLVGLASAAILLPGRRGRPPEEGRAGPALPFGPFLVLAAFLYLFRGPAFIAWYWSLTA